MQPKKTSENEQTQLNSSNKDCQDLERRLLQINEGGEERLVKRRDSLIQEIDKFQKTYENRSLGNICDIPELDTRFAILLRTQAFKLAEWAIFTRSELIRGGGEFSEYGAVKCLCLIPEELLNYGILKDVQDKMEGWKKSGQGEEVIEELEMIKPCPADKE